MGDENFFFPAIFFPAIFSFFLLKMTGYQDLHFLEKGRQFLEKGLQFLEILQNPVSRKMISNPNYFSSFFFFFSFLPFFLLLLLLLLH